MTPELEKIAKIDPQPRHKTGPFLDRILDTPSYGYYSNNQFFKPTPLQLAREFLSRMNVFQNRRNWLPLFGWTLSLSLAFPLYLFFTKYFSWPLLITGFLYSMVAMGSHGTFWLHRYSTHRAFQIKNPFFRMILRNLVIKIIPEEIYVVSHLVHHQHSEKPGDPYNVNGGWLYCFLADANHQMIHPSLTREDYQRLCTLMNHTGMRVTRMNSICGTGRSVIRISRS